MSELLFEAETHTYWHAGKRVPGVTAVLEQLQHLQGVPWEVLKAAQVFGTHVHMACDLYNRGELDEEALDPHLMPYLEGYKRFLGETGFTVTASEQRLFNRKLLYAGTADLFGTWKGTTWVVDLKSGVVPSTVGAQLAAYQNAAAEKPRRRLCVQLSPGDYRLFEQKDPGDFSLFLSALNCYRHILKHNPGKFDHADQSRRFENTAA